MFADICPIWDRNFKRWNEFSAIQKRHYRKMLKNSNECAVAEAHGFKCGYALSENIPRYGGMVDRCDICTSYSSTKYGIPSKVGTNKLDKICEEFATHFVIAHNDVRRV